MNSDQEFCVHCSGNKFSPSSAILTNQTAAYRQETRLARRPRQPVYSQKQRNKNRRSAWPPIFHRPNPVPPHIHPSSADLYNRRRVVFSNPLVLDP